jgi:hypothetical protein
MIMKRNSKTRAHPMLAAGLAALLTFTAWFAMPAHAATVTSSAYSYSDPTCVQTAEAGDGGSPCQWTVPSDQTNFAAPTWQGPYLPSEPSAYWPAEKYPTFRAAAWAYLGPVWTWGIAAAKYGYAVNNVPQVGDIVVWPANYDGAPSTGQAAYVEQVNPDGSIIVSQSVSYDPVAATETVQTSYVSRAEIVGPERHPVTRTLGWGAGPDYPSDEQLYFIHQLVPATVHVSQKLSGRTLRMSFAVQNIKAVQVMATAGNRNWMTFRQVASKPGVITWQTTLPKGHWTVWWGFTPAVGYEPPYPEGSAPLTVR